MKLEWTGERYVPQAGGTNIHYEHLHRYAIASSFVEGKKVLDIASGEGYGVFILAKKAKEVIGIEIDTKAIEHAREKYRTQNISFLKADMRDIPIKEKEVFDVIVCFEAIEHVREQGQVLLEIKRLLKKEGILIISSPNKSLHADSSNYQSPFHEKELYFEEFKALLENNFKSVSFLAQKAVAGSYSWPLGQEPKGINETHVMKEKDGYVFLQKKEMQPLFFIAVASNNPVVCEASSILIDASNNIDDLKKDIERLNWELDKAGKELKALKESKSWRLTAPLRSLRDFFKGKKRSKDGTCRE